MTIGRDDLFPLTFILSPKGRGTIEEVPTLSNCLGH